MMTAQRCRPQSGGGGGAEAELPPQLLPLDGVRGSSVMCLVVKLVPQADDLCSLLMRDEGMATQFHQSLGLIGSHRDRLAQQHPANKCKAQT